MGSKAISVRDTARPSQLVPSGTRETESRENTAQVKEVSNAPSESKKTVAAQHENIQARIRDRAYELYVQRGCRNGRADRDWLDAEEELLSSR